MSSAQKIIQAAAGNAAGEATYVEDVFSTYVYTGNGSTQTITNGIDLDGEGGLVWIKNRSAEDSHVLTDTERGAGEILSSNAVTAETTDADTTTSFNSSGFSIGADVKVNTNTENYVSWTFRKAPKFFDVVTYTGVAAPQVVPHNLGSVPGCIIVKETSLSGEDFFVYHRGMDPTEPENFHIFLNTSAAATDSPSGFFDTAPTDTHFTVGAKLDATGVTYVAYLFAHNDGDGEFGEDADQDIIKCGSYTGGTADNDITLGFEPQWVLIKPYDASDYWEIIDNMRGVTDSSYARLYANTSGAETSVVGDRIIFTPTGFQVRDVHNALNGSGRNYIYIAIRRGPMKTPESGTEVFSPQTTAGVQTTNFVVDAFFGVNSRTSPLSVDPFAKSRLQGGAPYLTTSSTNAEASGSDVGFDSNTGIKLSWSSGGVNWYFRRAPGFFDVVAYEGDGVSGRTVSHNLGVAPEMIITKGRSNATAWLVYHHESNANPEQYFLRIDLTNEAIALSNIWNDTAPTSLNFSIGTNSNINTNGNTYIAYLFATLPGVSKVGSYTGNGTSQTIDCGFSTGARFVLTKRTNSTGNWNVWDSERGIVAGNDLRLELNTTDAEDTGHDYIDPDSSGFIVNYVADDDDDSNVNGDEYIFLAIS